MHPVLRTISFLFFVVAPVLTAQTSFQLGVNLDDDGAFVNIINHTNRYSSAIAFDTEGWPLSDFDLVLMDGRPVPEWAGIIDDPERYRVDYSGRYACSFIGSATVLATGTSVTVENTSYDTTTNTTVFDLVVGGYPNANHGLVFLNFSNTRRTPTDQMNSGITKLRVNRPGYPLNTAQVFTDEFISLCTAADFACYRFYTVQNIWDGEPTYPLRTTWQQRKTPRDAAQVSMANLNGKRDAWCWEYMIELANILKKDIWLCIHQSCDSQYVAQLGMLLKNALDPFINIYVENSNEVWSPTQATHGPYNQADAQAHGITFDQNYARRTVELSRWFAAVFGQEEINNRIRVILSGQHGYSGRSDNHLSYINSTFGAPRDFIYATSTALYFGSTQSSATDPSQINNGMLEDITNQISNQQASTYRLNHINKANTWGLKGGCTSYEGGPGVPAGGGTANLSNQILAHRTQAMAGILKRNYLEGWRDLGGGLALYFILTSGYNRYGCWGITDDYTKPDRNYKMGAIREIISGTTGIYDANPSVTPSLELYPNPGTTYLTIHSASAMDVHVTDALGRNIWNGSVAGTMVLNTAHWIPGIYILRSQTNVVRFVKW